MRLLALGCVVLMLGGCVVDDKSLNRAGEVWAASGPWSVKPGVPVVTKHDQIIQVNKKVGINVKKFDVLMGPDPDLPAGTEAVGSFDMDEAQWNLVDGFAFVIGTWPRLKMKTVNGGADGSQIAGRTRTVGAGSDLDEFYYVSGSGKAWGDVMLSATYTIDDTGWNTTLGAREDVLDAGGNVIGYRYVLDDPDTYLSVQKVALGATTVVYVVGPVPIDPALPFVQYVEKVTAHAAFRPGLETVWSP